VVSKGTKVTSRRKRRVVKEVAAAKEEARRDYELVLIISPEVSEEEFEATLNNVSQLISDNGGAVSHVEQWGKRKLAYPIEHFMEGSYVLTRFKMRPALSKELEAKLKISEEVLRHLLIRLSS
jgi:small subunit ribosomal protein S6